MGTRLFHMLRKEFIQTLRDREMRTLLFFAPIIQLLVFSYAMASDVSHISMGICDRDQSVQSRELVSQFLGSGKFHATSFPERDEEIAALLDGSDVQMVLQINHGFGGLISSGKTAELQLLLDGTDSNTATIAGAYAARVIQEYNRNILVGQLERKTGNASTRGSFSLDTRAWFNQNLEKLFYFVPGVIAILVTLISLLLTAMAVVREKEIGTIEQIMVTPIRPWEFILGKTLPFACLCMVEVAVVTVVALFWFEVPLLGSLWILFLGTALYLGTSLGIGLFISTISRTQQQAMMIQFFYFQPITMLSGFAFPISNMPLAMQYVTYLNPMRYYLVIVRSVFLKGSGFQVLWPQMLPLGLMGIAVFLLASRRFRKTLA